MTAHAIRPGQLWKWAMQVNYKSTSWWPLEKVTDDARTGNTLGDTVAIYHDQRFVVVAIDDPGPWQANSNGNVLSHDFEPTLVVWYVVLLNGTLVWMCNVDFEVAELLCDVA